MAGSADKVKIMELFLTKKTDPVAKHMYVVHQNKIDSLSSYVYIETPLRSNTLHVTKTLLPSIIYFLPIEGKITYCLAQETWLRRGNNMRRL